MKKTKPNRITLKGLVIFLVVISGLIHMRYNWIASENDQINEVIQIAGSVEAILPKEDLKVLEAKPGDTDKSQYIDIKNKLKAIVRVNSNARFAYICTRQNGKLYFIADSEPEDSKDYSPPGQEYSEVNIAFHQPFKDGKPIVTDIYTDRWGSWRSAVIPIKEDNTGKTVAVFAMDFAASNWNKSQLYEMAESSLLIVLLSLALLFLFKFTARNKSLQLEISERKLAEYALRDSEANMRYIVKHDPNAIAMYDNKLHYLAVSDRYLRDYDVKEENIIGKHHYEVFPEMPQKWKDVHQRCLAGEIEHNNDDYFERPDGSITYNSWECRPWRRTNGEIGGIITYTEVTTDRKKAQIALTNSETRYRRLFESSKDGMIILDAETGKILDANPFLTQLFGISKEQIIEKAIWEIEYFKDITPDCNNFLELSQNEYVFYHDLSLRTSDGRQINVEFVSNLYSMDNQKVIQCNIRDFTNRKKTEKQVILLSRAIEQSPATVVITDKHGDIEYTNPKFTQVSGFTFEEVKGQNPRLGQTGAQSREFYKNLWNTILAGKDWHGEFHNRKKSGESYWESATISSIVNDRGDISHFVAVKEDITEKKKMLEDLIRAKDKAEESDRLKSAFLANMSHEIRTPMNGILGFAGLLKEPKLTGEEQQEYISIIEQSGARMLNIINDIVEISKIESGVMEVNPKELDVNKKLEYIYTFFKPEVEKKGMKLSIKNTLPAGEAIVKTDREKLYAILINLVKNAIKYSDQGPIELGYTKKDKYFEFFVKDHGIGIPIDRQEVVFNRFVQADMGDKRAFEGAGLGLSISKAYVEMLGGKIWVISEEGKGSVFYFTIPSHQPEVNNVSQSGVSPEEADSNINHLKILIAEDDKLSAKLLTKLVSIYSGEVLFVTTGVEAVRACQDNPDIDLVLMDINMPEMNGYEATRQIRQFNRDVVIIAQSAYALSHDREEALAAGCSEFISKPINKDKLIGLMKKHFEKQVQEDFI